MEAGTLDQREVLARLEEAIGGLGEPHRHLVELRLNRIRTVFSATDPGPADPAGAEAVGVDAVQRFRAARREAVLRAHISTLAADVNLLLNDPATGESARRFRDLLRCLDVES